MRILACGNSMFPTLVDGKYYKVKKLENNSLSVGDIIVYKVDNYYICHRVVKIIRSASGISFYKTKGDNCADYDSYAVSESNILGKVILKGN